MNTDVRVSKLEERVQRSEKDLDIIHQKLSPILSGPGLGKSVNDLSPVPGRFQVYVNGSPYESLHEGNGVLTMTFDAKGDLLVGTGADAYDNLAVGADGTFLTALASETLGINWHNFRLLNDISASITADQDNWAPTGIATASVIRVTTDASRNITGITTGVDGRILVLLNVGANNFVLKDDTTSTAANRFQLNGDVTVRADNGCAIWYDATSSRWRVWTGGGSSSPLTTKGDIYTYDTADQRLPVGTDGYILKADSSAATGLAWGTIGLAAFPYHDESLTDGASNFIFAGGDIVTVVGVPNP